MSCFDEFHCFSDCDISKHCKWSAWRPWGVCSATGCDEEGTEIRIRDTSNCGGQFPFPCLGDGFMSRPCSRVCGKYNFYVYITCRPDRAYDVFLQQGIVEGRDNYEYEKMIFFLYKMGKKSLRMGLNKKKLNFLFYSFP